MTWKIQLGVSTRTNPLSLHSLGITLLHSRSKLSLEPLRYAHSYSYKLWQLSLPSFILETPFPLPISINRDHHETSRGGLMLGLSVSRNMKSYSDSPLFDIKSTKRARFMSNGLKTFNERDTLPYSHMINRSHSEYTIYKSPTIAIIFVVYSPPVAMHISKTLPLYQRANTKIK